MLHGEGHVLLREVEHVEDDGLRAAVLAVVDGVHHLDDGFTLVDNHRLSPDNRRLSADNPALTALKGGLSRRTLEAGEVVIVGGG